MTVFGVISDDVKFIYQTFPVPLSMRAIIEVDVSYPDISAGPYPILGIYITQDHPNLKVKCSIKRFGQFGNTDMHPGITMDPYEARILNCNMENTTNMLHCTGDITVQDFKPRNFSYSFGFQCFNCLTCSLRGLVYNLKIYGQTNETHCVELSYWTADICYPYTQYGVFPNLLGGENINVSLLAFGCYEHSIPF